MDYATYQQRVLARCSNEFHGDKVDSDDFREALEEFIDAGNRLDRIKKALFYGRPFSWDAGQEAQDVITPLEEGSTNGNIMTHAILGIASEGVELVEALFKGYNNPTEVDIVNLQEEFGDLEWYRALGLHVLHQSHEDNLIQNDTKLEKRFGSTFTEEAANNRDLDAERKTLEGSE